jgi:hypothetical protein
MWWLQRLSPEEAGKGVSRFFFLVIKKTGKGVFNVRLTTFSEKSSAIMPSETRTVSLDRPPYNSENIPSILPTPHWRVVAQRGRRLRVRRKPRQVS